MKEFLCDALMLFVGCLLWIIWGAMILGLFLLVIFMIYQISEFANYWALLLLLADAVVLALIVAMQRVVCDFWLTYC